MLIVLGLLQLQQVADLATALETTGAPDARHRNDEMAKKDRVLKAVFAEQVLANIAWNDIEQLFHWLGGEVTEGRGSRVRVELNGIRAVFHRPHPEKEASKPTVRSVRRFLIEAGVTEE